MKKIILDFIQELLISDRIPYHFVSFPCADWDWFDFGLRSKILGLENLSLKMNGHLADLAENTLYHYVDLFQCNYSILKLPDNFALEDTFPGSRTPEGQTAPSGNFLVMGPVLFESFYGKHFDDLFRQLELPPQLMESLRNHYQNIPLLPFSSHYEGLMAVIANYIFEKKPYQIIFKSKGDLENLRHHYGGISRGPEQPFLNIQYIEQRYHAENLVITAVTHGNEALAMDSVRKLADLGIPPRLANNLRDKKDLTITLNTLMRKAAEQAGVHPIHIDSFSNQCIQQIEQLGSVEQCRTFQRKLALGYCRLIKKYNVKGYSLPVQKAVTYITSDLSADLSLKALSGRLNVTSSYLSSLFRKEIGMTLTDYVNQQRIAHARHLLADTHFPIKSIALQCGIPDLNYFVRMFKRTVGVTPKVYRDTAADSRQTELFSGSNIKEMPGSRKRAGSI